MYNTKVNLNANNGIWVIMMSQRRFISSNKRTTLVGDVDEGQGYTLVGTAGMWVISVPFSQFSCESKISLKT